MIHQDELIHYGRKGQKWGVIRTPEQLGHIKPKKTLGQRLSNTFKAKSKSKSEQKKAPTPKPEDHRMSKKNRDIRKMSNEEIAKRIERLNLEKQYKTLLLETREKGKKATANVLGEIGTSSVKNIGTQLTTYGLGKLVNKLFGRDIVNPKKGQKDK